MPNVNSLGLNVSCPVGTFLRFRGTGNPILGLALVDTGNLTFSLISATLAEALGLSVEPTEQNLSAFDCTSLQVCGRTTTSFPLHVEGQVRPLTIDALVIKDLPYPMNLSARTLAKNDITLKFSEQDQTLCRGENTTALVRLDKPLLERSMDPEIWKVQKALIRQNQNIVQHLCIGESGQQVPLPPDPEPESGQILPRPPELRSSKVGPDQTHPDACKVWYPKGYTGLIEDLSGIQWHKVIRGCPKYATGVNWEVFCAHLCSYIVVSGITSEHPRNAALLKCLVYDSILHDPLIWAQREVLNPDRYPRLLLPEYLSKIGMVVNPDQSPTIMQDSRSVLLEDPRDGIDLTSTPTPVYPTRPVSDTDRIVSDNPDQVIFAQQPSDLESPPVVPSVRPDDCQIGHLSAPLFLEPVLPSYPPI